jgi:hypothetical protein
MGGQAKQITLAELLTRHTITPPAGMVGKQGVAAPVLVAASGTAVHYMYISCCIIV